jgi:preprotein translocase subunit SecG
MLIGAAIAGALLWLATQFETTTTAAYWTFIGLAAAAGLVLALAQLAGGWTKWGAPRVTGAAFLVGFLPALVVGGWVLLASQPEGAWMQATAQSWANQIGAGGLLEAMTAVLPAVAFALGLLLGYTLDTTGARVVAAEPAPANDAARPLDDDRADERVADERVADEPVTAERRQVHTSEDSRVEADRRGDYGDEDYREPDRDLVRSLTGPDDREAAGARGGADGRRHELASRRDEDVRTRDDGGVPPGSDEPMRRDEPEGERRRGWFSRR